MCSSLLPATLGTYRFTWKNGHHTDVVGSSITDAFINIGLSPHMWYRVKSAMYLGPVEYRFVRCYELDNSRESTGIWTPGVPDALAQQIQLDDEYLRGIPNWFVRRIRPQNTFTVQPKT